MWSQSVKKEVVDEKVGIAKLISDEDTTKNEDDIGAGQR